MSGSIIRTNSRGEGIALDDAIFHADLADVLLCPVGQADLPPRHHLNDEALDAKWETIDVEQLLQKGVVDIVVCLLEVVVQLHDVHLLFLLHHVVCKIFNHSFLAPLGFPDSTLFKIQDASLSISKEVFWILLWMARVTIFVMVGRQVMGLVICRVFPDTTLEDEDGPAFKEPIVLLVPMVWTFHSTILFTSWYTAFLMVGHFLIGKE